MHSAYKSLYRFTFGLLALAAIVTEIIVLAQRHAFHPADFFSYFTIQSNLLAAAALLLSGYFVAAKKLASFKGAATLYMTMTGVIFAVLLAPVENAVLTAVPWDNIVLHYVLPVAMLLDWLFLQSRAAISFKQSLTWLTFPAAYVGYSLVRGAITNWYPYPFLNAHMHGYSRVSVTIAVLLVLVCAASQAVRKLPGVFALRTK